MENETNFSPKKLYKDTDTAESLLYINTLTGKTITVDYDSDDTILNIKQKIFQKETIPVDMQRLIFAGTQLIDNNSVDKYNIQKNAILQLVLRIKTAA